MKEKKSNMKKQVDVHDEDKASLIRLVGLFMIVYGILCFTSGEIGSILSVPFTFLVGSFAPIALLVVIVLGCYMLLFKKHLSSFSSIQYVLITLICIFALVLATATKNNETMTLADCFSSYVGKNGIYSYNLKFLLSDETGSVSQLGGGMLGYMFYGAINSLTGANHVITLVVSIIILVGVLFIFLLPYVVRFIKWCKKVHAKNTLKKESKRQKQIEKIEKKEKLKEERINNSRPVTFTFNNSVNDKKYESKTVDDLLETTEINITGDDYNFVSSNKKEQKLSTMLDAFDDDIYPERMKKAAVKDNSNVEIENIRLNDVFLEDFSPSGAVNEDITSVVNTNELRQERNDSTQEVIDNPVEVTIQEMNSYDHISIIPSTNEDKKETINNQSITQTVVKQPIGEEEVEENEEELIEDINPSINVKVDLNTIPYDLPPLYLLKDSTDNGANAKNDEIAKEKAGILMEKMKELNVSASINAYVVGPSVTRFEIALAPGVRVGSFTNLQEDFKLALGVNSIRIESPIPGKSAIGIEVPNTYRAMVSMKEIITSMPDKKHKLYVPVGKDIGGTPLSFPICDMPHCLISGATNSGKSVCANTIILSLLMNYKPNEVRLIMVDPKRVEMLFYKDIPHLLCPIITEAEKARVALDKLCVEMDKRFTTYSTVGVKNIASYNELMVSKGKPKMPFIILVVDEFAELMLCKNHNIVEEKIQKLAQLGRAAGIHLILSTQRPDVNVIPGTIKTNLPCRMTFRLSSLVDSRTVIDVGGAEKLLNNGDMLLLTPDFTGLRRVQGVYVSDKEIADVVEYCKKQVGPQYDPEFLDLRTEEEKQAEEKLKYALDGNNKEESSRNDSMYDEVKRFVIREQKASTSYLQRKFGIGYSKAARYIDMLEEEGIVGPENGSKPREVLVSSEDE